MTIEEAAIVQKYARKFVLPLTIGRTYIGGHDSNGLEALYIYIYIYVIYIQDYRYINIKCTTAIQHSDTMQDRVLQHFKK